MPHRICFVIHDLPHTEPGGGQIHTYRLGQKLRTLGWEVHFVIFGTGRLRRTEVYDGMVVHHVPKVAKPARTIRFLHWPVTLYSTVRQRIRGAGRRFLPPPELADCLLDADADVYVQVLTSITTGFVAEFTRSNNRPFVYLATHRDDCDLSFSGELWDGRPAIVKRSYEYGIRNADAVVVLAEYMRQELLKWVGLVDIRVIPLGYTIPDKVPDRSMPPYVLWTSGMRPYKRPFDVLELARRLPELRFIMCGGGRLYHEVEKRAKDLPNVTTTGPVPFNQIATYFERATVTVNTSVSEGFPDTFLRSWANGVPVVTVGVDPDEVICKNRLGFHTTAIDDAADQIRALVNDPSLRNEIGARAREYVRTHHDMDIVATMYAKLFEELIASKIANT